MAEEILNTVGVEIEFAGTSYTASSIADSCPRGWRFEHDGSCSVVRRIIPGTQFEFANSPNINPRTVKVEFGGELISPPMMYDSEALKLNLSNIFQRLPKEIPDNSVGIHVHVCVGLPPVEILRNIFYLGRVVERGFFRVSSGDLRVHRGESNGYKFCRPLAESGRQLIIDENENYRWGYEESCLRRAKSSKEFLQAFCRADYRPLKWMPARYYWLNFMAVATLGTLEFRPFNFSNEPATIVAWIDLCRAFTQRVFSTRIESDAEIITFRDFISIVGEQNFTSQDSLHILERMWFKGKFPTECVPQINHVCTQFNRRMPYSGVEERLQPRKLDVEEVEEILCVD